MYRNLHCPVWNKEQKVITNTIRLGSHFVEGWDICDVGGSLSGWVSAREDVENHKFCGYSLPHCHNPLGTFSTPRQIHFSHWWNLSRCYTVLLSIVLSKHMMISFRYTDNAKLVFSLSCLFPEVPKFPQITKTLPHTIMSRWFSQQSRMCTTNMLCFIAWVAMSSCRLWWPICGCPF